MGNNKFVIRTDLDAQQNIILEGENITASFDSIGETIEYTNTFIIGNIIRKSGSDWVLSEATNEENSQVHGMIQSASSTNFDIIYHGNVVWESHGFTEGSRLYLSSSGLISEINNSPYYREIGWVKDSNNIILQTKNTDTASFALTASYALNSSNIDTSSFITNDQTSSFITDTSSFITNVQTSSMTVLSSSYAETSSYALNAGEFISDFVVKNVTLNTGQTQSVDLVDSDVKHTEWLIGISSGSNYRTSKIVATSNGSTSSFYETTTDDIGNTDNVTMSVNINGSSLELLASINNTNNWNIQSRRNKNSLASNPFTDPTFKNRIINGQPFINQRGNQTVITTDGVFIADRWRISNANSAVLSSTIDNGFIEIEVTTADASMATFDMLSVYQNIEGYNVSDLNIGTTNAKTVTISFKHKHTKTGTYSVALSLIPHLIEVMFLNIHRTFLMLKKRVV